MTVRRHLRSPAVAVLLAALALGACRDRARQTTNPLGADSSLARDLTLAARDTSAQPQLRDVPDAPSAKTPTVEREPAAPVERRTARSRREPQRVARRPAPVQAPAPVAEAPAPAPAAPAPAPAPRTGVIASGTTFGAVTDSRVCASVGRPGDKLVARLSEPVMGTNGVIFPAGSEAVIEVAETGAQQGSGSPQMTFRVTHIVANGVTRTVSGEVVPTSDYEQVRTADGSTDKKRVIGGAVAGAIIGRIIGGSTKATVIGAAAGAAAGTAAARRGASYDSCLPAGASVRVTLTQPVQVELSGAASGER